MLVDKFFNNTLNLDSEKQKIINYIKMTTETTSKKTDRGKCKMFYNYLVILKL